MPSVRKSEKEKQREELAALLGEPVFLRDEAAPKIGKTSAAIRATARLHRASTTTVTTIARTLKTVQEGRQESVTHV